MRMPNSQWSPFPHQPGRCSWGERKRYTRHEKLLLSRNSPGKHTTTEKCKCFPSIAVAANQALHWVERGEEVRGERGGKGPGGISRAPLNEKRSVLLPLLQKALNRFFCVGTWRSAIIIALGHVEEGSVWKESGKILHEKSHKPSDCGPRKS